MMQSMTTAPAAMAGNDAGTSWRFGVIVEPDAPVQTILERIRRVEEMGFDQVFVPDHIGNLYDPSLRWFDGWSLLAVAAGITRTIRIGTLVNNPILRAPAVVAKQAITIDHLSGGRLDFGLGAGVFEFDHHAVGEESWTPRERARRFADYIAIVDGILRGQDEPFSFKGEALWARDVPTAPGSVQHPRPPLLIGGQSPTVLRIAAERADIWNTIGPMGATFDEALEATAQQNGQLDGKLAASGRNPGSLRRSLTMFDAFDPWSAPVEFDEVVERFATAGMTEFIIGWPPEEYIEEFERIASVVVPAYRR